MDDGSRAFVTRLSASRKGEAAVENVKRLSRPRRDADPERFDWLDDKRAQRPEWIAAFLEMKTVWHPIGV